MTVGAKGDVMKFIRANRTAQEFVGKALEDYLLARLGLPMGLWSACEMATQAVEKLLKAYILVHHHTKKGDPKYVRNEVLAASTKRLGKRKGHAHDIIACLEVAERYGLTCRVGISPEVSKINEWYSLRYPDNQDQPRSLSGGDLALLDKVIFAVWDEFKSADNDYYYVTGIMNPLYGCMLQPSGWLHRTYHVFGDGNAAFEARFNDLHDGIRDRLAVWRPNEAPAIPPPLLPFPIGMPLIQVGNL